MAACGSEDVPAATNQPNVITASENQTGDTTGSGDPIQSGEPSQTGDPASSGDPIQSGDQAGAGEITTAENPVIANDPHATEPAVTEPDEDIVSDVDFPEPLEEEMPLPFGENPPEAEATRSFYFPFVPKLDGVPGALFSTLPLDELEVWFTDEIISEEPQTSVNQSKNIYTFIGDFGLSGDAVKTALAEFYEFTDPRMFTGADVDVLLRGNETEINKHFASEYSIVVEDKIYPPHWVYISSAAAYKEAGITPAALSEKLALYKDLGLTDEALSALTKKINAYKG
jgi:hypothetical protein